MGWATRRVVHAFKARGGDLPPMLDQPGRNFCERTCYRYRQPGRNCGRPSAGRRRAGRRRRPRFISRTHWYIRGETALDGGVRCVSVVPGGGRLPGGGEGRGADDRPQVSTTRLRADAVVVPPAVARATVAPSASVSLEGGSGPGYVPVHLVPLQKAKRPQGWKLAGVSGNQDLEREKRSPEPLADSRPTKRSGNKTPASVCRPCTSAWPGGQAPGSGWPARGARAGTLPERRREAQAVTWGGVG